MNVLICGHRAFVATGLISVLERQGNNVDCFSRGELGKQNNIISGPISDLIMNPYFKDHYDVIINFIVLKTQSVDANISYINSLISLSMKKEVKHLIHLSSIMVYDNNENIVDEKTRIEYDTHKKGYGEIKIGVDKFLESVTNIPFKISFIRPGYVIALGRSIPFIKKLPFGFALIKGNRKSIMPIVNRETIHDAIANLIKMKQMQSVYLFVPSHNQTKYELAKGLGYYRLIGLPKGLILCFARLFTKIKILPKSFYVRVEGMYIETQYDSTRTEQELKITF